MKRENRRVWGARWGARPVLRRAGAPVIELAYVELEAGVAQGGGHPQRAVLAVGEELGEPVGEDGAGVVDAVAEDVQFARHRRALVDGRDLDGRDDPDAVAPAGGD